MLRHSGMLNYVEMAFPESEMSTDIDRAWKAWKEYECRNR